MVFLGGKVLQRTVLGIVAPSIIEQNSLQTAFGDCFPCLIFLFKLHPHPTSARLGSGLAWPGSDLGQLGLALLCSAWFGPVRFASAEVGLALPGLAHIGSAWLDSTRS